MPTELGKFTRLENSFAAYGNRLEGPLPTELGALTRTITGFEFPTNSFTGPLPTELGRVASHFYLRYESIEAIST